MAVAVLRERGCVRFERAIPILVSTAMELAMKTAAMSVAALAFVLGACTHTRETVVERPVPGPTKETVVERPVPGPTREVVVERPVPGPTKEVIIHDSPVAAVHRSCTYAGRSYSDGSMACQNAVQFRCMDGSWEGLNTSC
jgi:hypothetical protein